MRKVNRLMACVVSVIMLVSSVCMSVYADDSIVVPDIEPTVTYAEQISETEETEMTSEETAQEDTTAESETFESPTPNDEVLSDSGVDTEIVSETTSEAGTETTEITIETTSETTTEAVELMAKNDIMPIAEMPQNENIVYIDGVNGNVRSFGLTIDDPARNFKMALRQAYELNKQNGGDVTIKVLGTVTISPIDSVSFPSYVVVDATEVDCLIKIVITDSSMHGSTYRISGLQAYGNDKNTAVVLDYSSMNSSTSIFNLCDIGNSTFYNFNVGVDGGLFAGSNGTTFVSCGTGIIGRHVGHNLSGDYEDLTFQDCDVAIQYCDNKSDIYIMGCSFEGGSVISFAPPYDPSALYISDCSFSNTQLMFDALSSMFVEMTGCQIYSSYVIIPETTVIDKHDIEVKSCVFDNSELGLEEPTTYTITDTQFLNSSLLQVNCYTHTGDFPCNVTVKGCDFTCTTPTTSAISCDNAVSKLDVNLTVEDCTFSGPFGVYDTHGDKGAIQITTGDLYLKTTEFNNCLWDVGTHDGLNSYSQIHLTPSGTIIHTIDMNNNGVILHGPVSELQDTLTLCTYRLNSEKGGTKIFKSSVDYLVQQADVGINKVIFMDTMPDRWHHFVDDSDSPYTTIYWEGEESIRFYDAYDEESPKYYNDGVILSDYDTIKFPEPPSHSGYRFIGWYTTEDGIHYSPFDTSLTYATGLDRQKVRLNFFAHYIQIPTLKITKTVDKSIARHGDNLIYTITVSNIGGEATDVVVADILPKQLKYISDDSHGDHQNGTVTWTIAKLSQDESKQIKLTTQIL